MPVGTGMCASGQHRYHIKRNAAVLSRVKYAVVIVVDIQGIVNTIAANPDYKWSNDVVFTIGESKLPEHRFNVRITAGAQENERTIIIEQR